MSAAGLRATPLHDRHVALGARMVPFAGWEMPVQYAGIREEHLAVRGHAGVFDVSHMGEIETRGPQATELLQRLLSNDVSRIPEGGAQYTAFPLAGDVPGVQSVGAFPEEIQTYIGISAAIGANVAAPEAARAWLAYLQSDAARALFVAKGYRLPPAR